MRYTTSEYRNMLASFLNRWTTENINKIKLGEYTDIENQDTFCYWVETKTGSLGSIKGVPSNKFGIYRRKKIDKLPSPKFYNSDNKYSWLKNYGDTRNKAFHYVKDNILKVLNLVKNKKFEEIDNIHLHQFLKWKIAYLYSYEKLAPFFEKDLILFAAKELGVEFNKDTKISVLQKFIMKQLKGRNIYEFSNEIYDKYEALEKRKNNYFLVGSKYGGKHNKDILPELIKKEVISTGFAPKYDIGYLWNDSEINISKELNILLNNKEKNVGAKHALKLFLKMKPGDMIAIKSSGMPNPRTGKANLEIAAYAIVVEKDNGLYSFDNNLGHCINVKFIETNCKKRFEIGGYSKTVDEIIDKNRINKIFQGYETIDIDSVKEKLVNKKKIRSRKHSDIGNIKEQLRKGNAPYIVDQKHKQIQKKFSEYLKKKYGKENVFVEKDFIDIILKLKNKMILYEIKPYYWPEHCIKAGLGQLLTYSYFQKQKFKFELKIVGPNLPDEEEIKIIKFIKSKLKYPFEYESFYIN